MKICVLGNGILAKDFEDLDYSIISKDYRDFKIEYVLDYDVIINTHDCNPAYCDCSLIDMKKCNVDLPFLLSEFCRVKNKRYVHFSTADLYHKLDVDNVEDDGVCAWDSYLASRLLGEGACGKKALIIRTKNLFDHRVSIENALYRAIINTTPSKNIENYSWSVDIIRATVALLKDKEHGLYNLTSGGLTSQAEICSVLGITDVAPTCNGNLNDCVKLGIDKLMKHIVPMDIMDNIPKCFKKLKEELG